MFRAVTALGRELETLVGLSALNDAPTVRAADKALLGETAAKLRALRKPDPYKGKGIRYANEVVRRKVGKKAGAK